MKSRFFTDTQELDVPMLPKDKISVCLCLNRSAYEQALLRAGRMGISSGEYIERLICHDLFSACGTKDRPRSYNP